MIRKIFAGALCALMASAAMAAPPPGQLVSGWDGTQTRQINVDSSGKIGVYGAAAGGSIYGNNASGTAPTQPPVLGGGWDGTLVRTFLTDTSGRTIVNVNGTVAVTGSFFQATQPVSSVQQASIIGTLAAGTSATNSELTGCVFNTTAPTLTTGQQAATQCTNKGEIFVAPFAAPSGKTAITGTCTSTTNSAALTPVPNRGINVTLSGTFSATEVLQRSFDGGTTWFPITIGGSAITYTSAISELAWSEPESGVQIRLACTWVSGTVTYRISQ